MGYLNASKAQEGISRGLFCYLKRKYIYVLHFYKKSQKRFKNHEATKTETTCLSQC
ncbi:type II toxin-antitoxin system RelE/ParE family toxin [Proteus mirabilis]